MGMSAVHDQVGPVEGGCEKSLVTFKFQFLRHDTIGVRQHAVGGHDDITVEMKRRHRNSRAGPAYSEIVCTTLETGRELTVGSFTSFMSSSSYCGSVWIGAFAFICTTL